ncbi:hypothetical protein NLG97_g8257 [Lecanicillium saksenae]|uniref:Uncharacterized protein n=1 Tax=Lecanicillium saksenae TaxID=468837 RepID=A0ACC1QL23_9HYPO|nr:hypothetical protein NLG97_g8257 [Lecanicillium saksenae]
MPDLESQRLLDFIGKMPIEEGAVEFFSSKPESKAYLDKCKNLLPVPFYSRLPKKDGADTFFGETIKSHDTLPYALLLLRSDIASLKYDFGQVSAEGRGPDTVCLFQIGSKLNGYRDTTHGGLLASLLDEVVGFNVDGLCSCIEAQSENKPRTRLYTGYLNTSYRKPVSPGIYAVESRLVKRDGRKWFLKGQVVGTDGTVYTEAEVLYIQSRDSLL